MTTNDARRDARESIMQALRNGYRGPHGSWVHAVDPFIAALHAAGFAITKRGGVTDPVDMAHEYAELFSEWQRRNDYQTFSQRQRLHSMTNDELVLALDGAKLAIAAAGTENTDKEPTDG